MNTIDSAIRNWIMSLVSKEDGLCAFVKIVMLKKKNQGPPFCVIISKPGIFVFFISGIVNVIQ